jgi:hypothetical protein
MKTKRRIIGCGKLLRRNGDFSGRKKFGDERSRIHEEEMEIRFES